MARPIVLGAMARCARRQPVWFSSSMGDFGAGGRGGTVERATWFTSSLERGECVVGERGSYGAWRGGADHEGERGG
jgi:hypothetical protein